LFSPREGIVEIVAKLCDSIYFLWNYTEYFSSNWNIGGLEIVVDVESDALGRNG